MTPTPPPVFRSTPAWTRRRLLTTSATGVGALFGAQLLSACGSDDDPAASVPVGSSAATAVGGSVETATTALSVGMGWIKNVEYGGSWLALESGFYDQQAIEADYLAGGPNAPSPAVSVAASDANIGVIANMLSFLDAVNEGNDFVVFGTQYQISPGAVLSLADKPIRTPEDLVGITFLGQEGVDVSIDAVLEIAGLPKDYNFVVAGFTPDPLIEGQGDAYSCFAVNQPITLEQQGLVEGEDFVVTSWADLGIPAYANLFFAERSYVEENRDAVVRFMRATIMGWEQNETDPAVAAALAVDNYGADLGLDIVQQTRQNELQIPLMKSELTDASGLFRIDPEVWDGPMATAYLASGRETMPSAVTVVDLTILDEVYGDSTTLLGT